MDLKNFAQAIRELADEKGVPEAKVIETIELAIGAAYKKDYGRKGQIIRARFNPETGTLQFSQIKIVVDATMIKTEEELAAETALAGAAAPAASERSPRRGTEEAEEAIPQPLGEEAEPKKVRFNAERHIMLDEAEKFKPDAALGEELEFPLEAQQAFGRIASQTAKQVIIQRIREAEREATYNEYKVKEGEIISGIVQRIEGRNVFVDLGRGIGVLPPDEQIPRERHAIGGRTKALLLAVEKDTRGPGIFLSRSHPQFLKKLFKLEVPEINSGVVEIKIIAREAGSRSKVAVASNDPAVDPVGSMVGQRGVRVSTVMSELSGEKIDIIEWAEDHARFVANALSPAKILDVVLAPERREATVIAPDDQLSLAIGKGGQNVRLAAKLTGWRIDVRSNAPANAAAEDREPPAAEPLPEHTPAVEALPEQLSPAGGGPQPEAAAAPEPSARGPEPVKPAKRKTRKKALPRAAALLRQRPTA